MTVSFFHPRIQIWYTRGCRIWVLTFPYSLKVSLPLDSGGESPISCTSLCYSALPPRIFPFLAALPLLTVHIFSRWCDQTCGFNKHQILMPLLTSTSPNTSSMPRIYHNSNRTVIPPTNLLSLCPLWETWESSSTPFPFVFHMSSTTRLCWFYLLKVFGALCC